MNRLLAFGGPWNEQVITVRPGVVLAPVPTRQLWKIDDPSPYGPAMRTVRYNPQQFYYHDTRRCPPLGHSERCAVVGTCLVAEGYPKQRIVDSLNALAAMCFALHAGDMP